MSRPLYFGAAAENTLLAASTDDEHLLMLRSKYRYAVFTLKLSPAKALSMAVSVTAGGALASTNVPLVPTTSELYAEDYYSSAEHAILAMAEYSGLGYETVPAFRAAWRRGVSDQDQDGARPFHRACGLAVNRYDSIDADLLPKVQPIEM